MTLLALFFACTPATIKTDDTGAPESTPTDGAPAFTVSPSSLDFATVFTGSIGQNSVTVSNTGGTTLSLTASIASDHADSYAFVFDTTAPAPDSDAVLSVTLTPSTWGNYLGTLTITDGASGISKEVPITALVEEDQDQDGYGSVASGGTDCNDTDATVNPGKTENWYNGVDEDCAGDDDFDQDKDGHQASAYGGDDCDDNNNKIYTGANDPWYSGLDEDCAGNDDYDQDYDGYDAVVGGGDDCEDHDASIHPGAADAWYDGLDTDCAGNNDYDQDGDGFTSSSFGGDDCDDLNALAYPGAPEIWYDGMDEACDAGNDYDQDGDGLDASGYGGTDCVDTDASAYPGAPDTWYDGVDSDCGGNSDYDQDYDGYDSSSYGGDDCDDVHNTVHPGATETWYDGIDSDCSGGSDYDQDGDGHLVSSAGGDDCDDTDARAYPGATEIWYDGVDEACDGGNDYDQDGDGVDSSVHGGSDCNDTDPTVTGPSTEVMDGQDNDCNGYVDDLPISSWSSGVIYGAASSAAIGTGGQIAVGGDLTGDGGEDLAIGSTTVGYGYTWVIAGSDWDGANGTTTTYATATIAGDSAYNVGYRTYAYYYIGLLQGPSVDVDGDGTADLITTGTNYYNYYYNYTWYSESFLFTGGASLSGSLTTSSNNVATFTGDSTDDLTRCASAGDVDGDGLNEIVTGNARDNYYSYTTYQYTYLSGIVTLYDGSYNADYDIGDAAENWQGDSQYDYLGWSVNVQDLNDDGYADVVMGAPGRDAGGTDRGALYVVDGNASLSWNGDAVSDSATLEIDGTSNSSQIGLETQPQQGDLDGDGKIDLVAFSQTSGAAWLWWDASSQSGTTTVSSADASFSGTAGSFASAVAISDWDGDGADDLWVGDPSNDVAATDAGAVWIYNNYALWTGAVTTADGAIWGAAAGDNLGDGLSGGHDVDGDGKPDVGVGAPGADGGASAGGAVYLVKGQ